MESLNSSHPFQDLFDFIRHPIKFSDRVVADSWNQTSNWMLFKSVFIYVLIASLVQLSSIPHTAHTIAAGLSSGFEEIVRAMSDNPSLSTNLNAADATLLASLFWVVLNFILLPKIFVPLMAFLSIVFFSALLFLFTKLWGISQEIKFSRLMVFSAYAHWAVFLTMFFHGAGLVILIKLGILFYLARTLKAALSSTSLGTALLPSTFSVWSGLILIDSVLYLVGFSL